MRHIDIGNSPRFLELCDVSKGQQVTSYHLALVYHEWHKDPEGFINIPSPESQKGVNPVSFNTALTTFWLLTDGLNRLRGNHHTL